MSRIDEIAAQAKFLIDELGIKWGDEIHYGDSEALTLQIIEMQRAATKYLQNASSLSNKGFPDGCWYMCTVTSVKGSSEESMISLHEICMGYFAKKGIKVYLAAMEKSSIYHIHYVVRMSAYQKNEGRDLHSLTGVRVRFEPKVKTLKQWRGLMKYVLKREYVADKADTQVRTLIQCVKHTEGKGYTLCIDSCPHHKN